MDMLRHDFRQALRLLLRQPGLSATILLTLALGIGANTAVFSVVHAVLLRPLPYPESERLVMVGEKRPAEGRINGPVAPADYLDWATMHSSFTAIAGFSAGTADLTGVGDPVQLPSALVSASFFDVFGIRALHGRTFADGEDIPGRHRVVVLSHGLWQDRFGGRPVDRRPHRRREWSFRGSDWGAADASSSFPARLPRYGPLWFYATGR